MATQTSYIPGGGGVPYKKKMDGGAGHKWSKVLDIDLLRLNTLGKLKSCFKALKGMTSTPSPVYIGEPPPPQFCSSFHILPTVLSYYICIPDAY